MLLAIIAISLFIISIVFIKFTKRRIHVYETINDEIRYGDGRFTNKEYNILNENDKRIKILENINNIFWFTRLISGIVICILFIVILCLRIGVDNKVQLIKIEHDGLIKRLEIINSEYEDVSKSDVIKDITEWNKTVQSVKYYYNNPLIGGLRPKEIVDAYEYIEIE